MGSQTLGFHFKKWGDIKFPFSTRFNVSMHFSETFVNIYYVSPVLYNPISQIDCFADV